MTARARFRLSTLGLVLDFGEAVTVTGAEISGDFLDLTLEGDLPQGLDEVVADYSVHVGGRRQFVMFKAPEGAPAVPIGDTAAEAAEADPPEDGDALEATVPPTGPGSRGARRARGGS